MLKRLFLIKSKEILKEVESAESIIKSAEEKIEKLKSVDNFTLLREEMMNLIYNSNFITTEMYKELYCNTGHYLHKNYERENVYKLINECLDEIKNLTKEKDNAISQRNESEK